MSGDIWWYGYCGNRSQRDAFLLYQLSVNTSNPDLTRCFQTTILTWVPCGLFLIWSPLHILHLSRRTTVHNKWSDKSRLNAIKLVLGVLLCLTVLLQLIWVLRQEIVGLNPPPSELVASCLILISLVLSTLFIHYEFKKGVVSSGILFFFWLLLTLCNIVTFRSYIMDAQEQGEVEDMFVFVTFYVYFAFLACQFLIGFFGDSGALLKSYGADGEKKPLLQNEAEEDEWIPTPQAKAGVLSRVTYVWILGTIVKGYKKALRFSDLCDLMYYDKSKNLVPKFEKAIGEKVFDGSQPSSLHIATLQKKKCVDSDTGEHQNKKPESKPAVSLLRAVLATSGWQLFGAATLRGMAIVFTFVNPQLLRLLIGFIEGSDPYVWKGYMISVLLMLSNVLSSLCTHGFLFLATTAGMRLRTMITCAIYRKALRLSSASRRTTTVGEIVNLMSVDAVRIQESCTFVNLIWTVPVLIALSIYFLWGTIGPSSLAGFAVLLLIVPSNAIYLANKIRQLQQNQMHCKDNRIKMMNEILSGIKVLKFFAWEPSFQDKVLGIRELELNAIKKAAYINACGAISWFLAPYMVSLATFAVYVLSSPENILDADKAFVSLSLINVLNSPLSLLAMGVSYAGQAAVSVKRINKFLRQEELEGDAVERTYIGDAVRINDGVFSWSKCDRPVLTGIELSIPDGALIAVVGQVGSGKSSLIASMLGEMHVVAGQINIKGSVAYVSQQAWIQNATLKDNILFGKPLNQRHYQKIIRACAMEPDLRILPGQDMTEIGEKGINLSGGQKQRVSLARAVYQECDVYLLDDPLSAVDAHVGKHIFEQVVGPSGLLKNKTRILVTHGVTYLPHVDRIVVIKDGRISEMGTYEELLSHDGAFAEFIRTYLNEEDSISESDAEERKSRVELQRRLSHLSAGERSPTERSESESGKTSQPEDTANVARKRRKYSPRRSSSRRESQIQLIEQEPRDKLITEETAQVGAIKYGVLMMYIRAGGVALCVLALLFHLFFIVAQVLTNIWLSEWSNDEPVNGSWPRDRTDMRLGVYGALGVAQGVFVLVEAFVVAVGCVMASRVLHAIILDRILKAPMSYFDATPLGRIINRFSKDMDVIDFNMPVYIRAWLFAVAPLLSTLVVISYTTPYFLIVTVPIGIIYYLIQKLYTVSARQFKRIDSIRRSPLYTHFDESVVGATSIRAYRQQQRFIAHSDELIDNSQRAWYSVTVTWRSLGVLLESLGAIVVFFASLFAVIQRDSINGALVGLSVSYALQVTNYMNTLIRSGAELETYVVSIERIKEYAEVATEADWIIEDSRPSKDWPVQGQVEFVDYSTRYRPGLDLVLRGINCSIEPQQKVGIVGRTGAGKSSLTLSLFRIIEAADGKILVDGQDISKFGLHDLRSRLTIIPQDPVLFSGTLRMNLDPFEKCNEAAIWCALEHAHLKTYVSGLKEGLEYECGEGGEALSVGQRQLVCLARALLRKTKILILDEATAAVDMETDDLIQATIRTQFSKCTVLTIAHRLNTIMDYDLVLVLDNGQARQYGSPSELLKDKKGIFHGMAKDANLL